MSFQIALNFEDGVTRFIEANSHETVADAAYRQGINIPLDCRDGACGTCKCFAEAGTYELGDEYIEDALSEDEVEQGYVLTCQMRAASDCVLRVPASSTVCKTQQASFEASISDVRQLSESTIALSIKAKDSADTADALQRMHETSAQTGTTNLGALLRAKLDKQDGGNS